MRRLALLHDYCTCLRIVGLVSGLLEETALLDAHYLRLSEDSENTDPHRHVSDVLATSGVGDVHDVRAFTFKKYALRDMPEREL